MKHVPFFKTCPVPEVFPVVQLQMFTSTAGRWRDDISNMVLLHSENECPLMDASTAVRAALWGPHKKAIGAFRFSKNSAEKNIAPSLIRGALNAKVNWIFHSATCQEKGFCRNIDYSHSNKQLSYVQYVTDQTGQSEI